MARIKPAKDETRPDWQPNTVEERARWNKERFDAFPKEEQEAKVHKLTPCCRSYYGGSYSGSQAQGGVRYIISCTNCGKVYSNKPRSYPRRG